MPQAQFLALKQELAKVIVGQEQLIDRLILALLCNGHILIEGIPGLAKTLTVTSLAQCLGLAFSRIQFTPDLLPSDITGTPIYQAQTREFVVKKGPIFANLVLADEINRSPAKVQAALLEAMQEKQVSLDGRIYQLPNPFLVLATQNPIEQEGTYPLPEAQLDRFMLKVVVSYPSMDEERLILRRMANPNVALALQQIMKANDILDLRKRVAEIRLDASLEDCILKIVDATRQPQNYGLKEGLLRYGASPRATINLALASKAMAFMEGRSYVNSADIRALTPDILRHRIGLTYHSSRQGLSHDSVIDEILQRVCLS